MSFNFLPKNAITGRTSSGEKFTAFEYDFGTYALLQLPGFIGALLIGGLFSAISGPIILIMLMLQFTGRFNLMYLTVPILSGYWLYDCHNGWLLSAMVNFIVEKETLLFLCKMNVACIAIITVMTLLGKTIYKLIVSLTNDVINRYIILFVLMFIVFLVSYVYVDDTINENWLGITEFYKDLQ